MVSQCSRISVSLTFFAEQIELADASGIFFSAPHFFRMLLSWLRFH
jgi:hypothetical protein